MELLVVLAIISILTTVVLSVFGDIKARGRDSRRVADLNALTKALALYLSINDTYPPIDGPPGILIDGNDAVSVLLGNNNLLQGKIKDPINSADFYYLYFSKNPNNYVITYCLETNTISGHDIGCGGNNTLSP